MTPISFDPDRATRRALLERAEQLLDEVTGDPARRVLLDEAPDELIARLLADRPGEPGDLDAVFRMLGEVLSTGTDNTAAGDLGYIPGSGLVTAAIADLIGAVVNRYTGLAGPNPAAVALEASVLSWLTELFDLPATAQATLLSGGSAANLSAMVVAREKLARDAVHRATVYVGEHAHASVMKSARLAGIRPDNVRVCPSSDGLHVDVEAARLAIKQDRADGFVPTALVGAAGTTNAGTIDPLRDLAALAHDERVWFHVDAAYGGFFQLTERGGARLAGIERADSITLDPHKSLFAPFGTGALLVRDVDDLRRAFAEDADYLRDLAAPDALPDLSSLTPELTRRWRGLELWLPLKLHGIQAFRDALDAKLDLAAEAAQALAADPLIELLAPPELSIVTFRVRGDDAQQDRVREAVNAPGDLRLSSTVIGGQVVLRLAVLSHRTGRATVGKAVERIRAAAQAQ